MKLRFEVDQAACFRKGIDCPKSIVTIEVDPSKLSKKDRDLIADRLMGIDVCQLRNSNDGTEKLKTVEGLDPVRIIADSPDYAGLMAAVTANQAEVDTSEKRHRAQAFSIAEAGIDTVELMKAHRSEKK